MKITQTIITYDGEQFTREVNITSYLYNEGVHLLDFLHVRDKDNKVVSIAKSLVSKIETGMEFEEFQKKITELYKEEEAKAIQARGLLHQGSIAGNSQGVAHMHCELGF